MRDYSRRYEHCRAIPLVLAVAIGACQSAAQAQTPTVSGVFNGASFAAVLSPGMIAEMFGANLADASLMMCSASNSVLPTTCNGVSISVNGKAAPLYYTSPTQISFQIPVDVSGTSAAIQLTRQTGGQTLQSSTFNATLAPTAPGLFTIYSGSLNLVTALDSSGSQITASNPARPGDTVTIYGTGFGATNPVVASGSVSPATPVPVTASVTATVGSKSAVVVFAGLVPGETGGENLINLKVPDGLNAGTAPVVVTVGGVNSQTGALLPVAGPKVTIDGISNNASGSPGIETGSWVSVYGSNLSASSRPWQASDFSGNTLPTVLDGVSVKINGKSAAICYISPTQVNVQAPTDTATGTVQVEVISPYGSATGTATLQQYAPGFYTFQNKYVAAVHTDGVYVAPVGYFGAAYASRPAQPGEVLLLFGTGFGPTNPAVPAGQTVNGAAPLADLSQLRLRIGGAPVTVQFGGIVLVGEYQFNVVVPAAADGDQAIVADIGGVSSQSALLIPIKN
jgi:uncharacterized protein (TIGR03437 family)